MRIRYTAPNSSTQSCMSLHIYVPLESSADVRATSSFMCTIPCDGSACRKLGNDAQEKAIAGPGQMTQEKRVAQHAITKSSDLVGNCCDKKQHDTSDHLHDVWRQSDGRQPSDRHASLDGAACRFTDANIYIASHVGFTDRVREAVRPFTYG